MAERDAEASGGRPTTIYCIVPRDLADALHETLRRHFSDHPNVRVVVERREDERRRPGDTRRAGARASIPEGASSERRLVRGKRGRRVAERRAMLVPSAALELPRKARRHADRIQFAERLEPSTVREEDADTARLVMLIQAGDRELFARLYDRYFDRVFRYLAVVLGSANEAEDAAQQSFANALEALPRYEHRGQPFRAWLFRIARNHGVDERRRRGRVEPTETEELNRVSGQTPPPTAELEALALATDSDLELFIARLPLAQRQVLMLSYLVGLSDAEIAEVLGYEQANVRMMRSRALLFLRDRLTAVGHRSRHSQRIRAVRLPREAPVLRARRWALMR